MRKKLLIMIMLIAAALFNSYGAPEEVGRVSEIDRRTGDVTVTVINGLRVNMGDRLQIETDNGKIVLEVTFPMFTLSKCKIRGKGKLSQLSKGMKVYRYSKDEPVEDTAVKPGKTEIFGKMEFCYIPGGTFMMGSPESEKDRSDDEKQHRVTVSPFWMGKYEVTQKQYTEIMGTNPSNFKSYNSLPVERVSWYDAIEFCNKMSEKYGFKPYYKIYKNKKDIKNKNKYDEMKYLVTIAGGKGFRLPTEAEWEFACRAGTLTSYYWGDNKIGDYNSGDEYDNSTKSVNDGLYNAYGLYNMHGNVWEWCWDWYSDNYYKKSSQKNPKGPNSGLSRIKRGGSWKFSDGSCRCANRSGTRPDDIGSYLGFRVVCSI